MSNQTSQENLIALLGLEVLPDAQKIALLGKMSDLVQKRVTARILDMLPKEDQETFVDAASRKDAAGVQTILQKHTIDMMAFVAEEAGKVKEEMKGVVESLKV